MTRLEELLRQVRTLSASERLELLDLPYKQTHVELDEQSTEAAIGQRGLAAWTESTRGDDWSAFYPESLQNGQGSTS